MEDTNRLYDIKHYNSAHKCKKVKDRQKEEADFGCLCKTHLQVQNGVVKESQRRREREEADVG